MFWLSNILNLLSFENTQEAPNDLYFWSGCFTEWALVLSCYGIIHFLFIKTGHVILVNQNKLLAINIFCNDLSISQ